jgi:hypothetical protein
MQVWPAPRGRDVAGQSERLDGVVILCHPSCMARLCRV